MRKLALISLMALSGAGCLSDVASMQNNKFLDIAPAPTTAQGYWTGSIGAGIATLKLNPDGSGFMCEDNNGVVNSYQVKLGDNVLYAQNGSKVNVKSIDTNQIILSILGKGYALSKDNDLKLATQKCLKELN